VARQVGIAGERIFLLQDGDVLEFGNGGAQLAGRVPAGRILVDGKGIGDVGDEVLRDRQHLAQDGMVVVVVGLDRAGAVVVGPEIISRGFADLPEGGPLLDGARSQIVEALGLAGPDEKGDPTLLKPRLRATLRKYFQKSVERRPLILPIILEL
jgi:ribonuclease J